MDTVGVRTLKDRLSEYLRRVSQGEAIRVSRHGEVVAELHPPGAMPESDLPFGLYELVRSGMARSIVRNAPERYRPRKQLLTGTTSRELLDWDRDAAPRQSGGGC